MRDAGRVTLRHIGTFRFYCRAAAVVFGLYTAYPLVMKIAEDRLAHDWAHSALHLASAVLATYAGWFARSDVPAKMFTWAIGVLYGILGVAGWFIDGLLLDTPVAIPLDTPANVFHLVLAVPALALGIRSAADR